MSDTTRLLQVIGMLALVIFFVLACNRRREGEPQVEIDSQYGKIVVEINTRKAPKTANAFLNLVRAGAYDNTYFYRVLKSDPLPSDYNSGLIQGGIYNTNPGKTYPFIEHESTLTSGLSHESGTISMARTETGTASTEFFICIGDQTSLDAGGNGTDDGQGFAAFGKVVKGMATVRKIQALPSHGDRFDEPVKINSIKISD